MKLDWDKRIVETIRVYNAAVNHCLRRGYEIKTFNKVKLHDATYYEVRKQFPQLNSSFVCTARDLASDMLKREKMKRLPKKKSLTAIRFNHNTFKPYLKKGVISLSTVYGRIKIQVSVPDYFKQYLSWHISAATMHAKGDSIYFHLVAETESPKKVKPSKVLGVDRGIINPVVTSDNQFFNSRHLRAVKGRMQWLKARLQSKGTRSAKRHLKRLRGREQRFVRDVNHCLSKELANSSADVFVLEKLRIKRSKKNGRRFNKLLGSWSYTQFQQFLEYKAEALGKTVEYVNPRHTSQRCSRCGEVRKANRKGVWYMCRSCGFKLNSDLNAARNIAVLSNALDGRVSVNAPIVAT